MQRERLPKIEGRTRYPIRQRQAFSLVELVVVIAIIGILLAFILSVSFASVEQARSRATQALIVKLEVALNERVDALLSQSISPNGAHQWLASIDIPPYPGFNPNVALPWGLISNPRAEVIARTDLMKMEMPDVFYIQNTNPQPNDYPISLVGRPFSVPNATVGSPYDLYVLPLGHAVAPAFLPAAHTPPYTPLELAFTGPGSLAQPNPAGPPFFVYSGAGRGIFGGSYDARAALHKVIGYGAEGTDAADNDGDGLIDEHGEGTFSGDIVKINRFLANHNHATARSEMLYALLVEGSGPLGNAFNAEDFTTAEVKDTDDDGAPEFVDGWGKPLQFYRWPAYYPSEGVQKGSDWFGDRSLSIRPDPLAALDSRPNFPMDPTGLLVAPAWWGEVPPTTFPVPISRKAAIFSQLYMPMMDPNYGQLYPIDPANPTGPRPPFASSAGCWDRSGAYARRAFGCKFLVVSAGPDQETGLYEVPDATIRGNVTANNPDLNAVLILGDPTPTDAANGNFVPVQIGEGWAAYSNGWPLASAANLVPSVTGPPESALDNIDSHTVLNKSRGVQ